MNQVKSANKQTRIPSKAESVIKQNDIALTKVIATSKLNTDFNVFSSEQGKKILVEKQTVFSDQKDQPDFELY